MIGALDCVGSTVCTPVNAVGFIASFALLVWRHPRCWNEKVFMQEVFSLESAVVG
jgi:hypothetical protein